MDKHYQFTYKGIKLDPYRILKVYGISDPAQQHAIKKLLRAGESVKPLKEDIKEVIVSLTRWLEILEEDSDCEEFGVEPLEEALAEKTHKILTKEEALKALREGYKLTCKEWDEDEFLFMRGLEIFDELDRNYSDGEFNQIVKDHNLYIKC